MSIGFYKLLNLWISSRNGRKIRVKLPNGYEVETSQLTHKEFSELFADLHEVYCTRCTPNSSTPLSQYKEKQAALLQKLNDKRLNVLTEEELQVEDQRLKKVYFEKREKLSKPIHKKSASKNQGNRRPRKK